jgi:hypothetical protein
VRSGGGREGGREEERKRKRGREEERKRGRGEEGGR